MASATIRAFLRQRAMRHAATDARWLSTAAMFRQPSIRRSVICPLTTRLKRRISAASSLGSEPCVFTRRLRLFQGLYDRENNVYRLAGDVFDFGDAVAADLVRRKLAVEV